MYAFSSTAPSRHSIIAAVLLTATCMAAGPSTRTAAPLKVETEVVAGERSVRAVVFLVDGKALVFEGEPDTPVSVVFDLAHKSWRDVNVGRTVTLGEAEKWAEASRERKLASLEKVRDEQQRAFVGAMLDPKLRASEQDGQLVLRNDSVSFNVTPAEQVPDAWIDLLLAYDRLNAWHKAMTDRKLPPFTQLAVLDELAQRRLWPRSIQMTVRTPAGNVELRTTLEVSELTESERTAARKLLAAAAAP